MANRTGRARIAAETVAIAQSGHYIAPSGAKVSIEDAVKSAVRGTRLITPSEAASLHDRTGQALTERRFDTNFEVVNEGTFTAGRRLVEQFGAGKVAALNFASAKNPGGGFLGGSQAQEESLARASALVQCLESQMAYYEANRSAPSSLYTDHLIVSPKVPVFRDEADGLLEEPWEITVLTSPAPNAGAVMKNEPGSAGQIEPTFRRRIEHVLSAAVLYDQTALVLGAWGCGVFANEPAMVARLFAEFLQGSGRFASAFQHVTFAVLDRQGDTLAAFADVFGK